MEPKKKKIDPRRSHLRRAEDEERKEDKKKIDPRRLSQKCGPEHTLNGGVRTKSWTRTSPDWSPHGL